MTPIHQLYCTHCTHGSSALERRQGELAARMLGYSVRAGSLEGEALRQAYRQVERYVSYHLPRDTPAEQKLHLTADTAPRRMVFLPEAGPWQVIGQISYRPTDTEGRPGCYFAHLLCRERSDDTTPWTMLDALQLWNASGWVREDSADHPFVLPTLDRLDALGPGIEDKTLLAFLRGENKLPNLSLPGRWADVPADERVDLLRRTLGALLTTGTTRRQTVLLAVEPDVAAVLFHGVGRLLPPGPLRASVSMSTFEATIDRLTTSLAATTFFDPAGAEFRPDALRGRGIAISTFDTAATDDPSCNSQYAAAMVRRLVEAGPTAVDAHLATIAAVAPAKIESLEQFAQTDAVVDALFTPGADLPDLPWQADAALTNYARRRVLQRLAAIPQPEPALRPLCGRPGQIIVLQLAATIAPGSPADEAVRFLLRNLPDNQIAHIVGNAHIDDHWQAELLAQRIESTGKTPHGCEWIWDSAGESVPLDAKRQVKLAALVIGSLSPKAALSLLFNLETPRRHVAVERLLEACRGDDSRWPVLGELLRHLDVASLVALWQRLGERLFELPKRQGSVLSARLTEILDTLHEHPDEFATQLNFLLAADRRLTDPTSRQRLQAWQTCREAIGQLGEGQPEKGVGNHLPGTGPLGTSHKWFPTPFSRLTPFSGLTAIRRKEAAARRLAEAILVALPAALVEDDARGSKKQECLKAIGQRLCGGELLPRPPWQNEALWKKIEWRLEMGNWPSIPLRKLVRGPAAKQQMWISLAVAAAVVLGVIALVSMATFGTGNKPADDIVLDRRPQPPATVPLPATNDPSDDSPVDPPESPKSETPTPEEESSVVESLIPDPIETPAAEEMPLAAPLIQIEGEFAARMSKAAGLPRPAVAVLALHVVPPGRGSLPDAFLQQYTVGATVQEVSRSRPTRYIDLPDLTAANETPLLDGVETVLVQFRFSRRLTDPTSPPGAVATSGKWAEIPIQPAGRYDVEFTLPRPAREQLEQLAKEK